MMMTKKQGHWQRKGLMKDNINECLANGDRDGSSIRAAFFIELSDSIIESDKLYKGEFMEIFLCERIEIINKALLKSWSLESSSKWCEDNPAKGQCGVTALVINDLLGGEIRKTKLHDGWHYYNIINGVRYDFTALQFKEKIEYMDVSSTREDAFSDTNEKQYHYLKQTVQSSLED